MAPLLVHVHEWQSVTFQWTAQTEDREAPPALLCLDMGLLARQCFAFGSARPEETPVDVGEWLKGFGLECYEAAFRENGVDAEVLPTLTSKELKDIGVSLGSVDIYCAAIKAAARLILALKLSAVLSYRVAMERNSLILAK